MTKGYLRGWLTFDDKQRTKEVRETVILHALENEEYEDLLLERLHVDTALVAGGASRTRKMLDGLDKTYNLYIGLKLPEVARQIKIKDAPPTLNANSLEEMRKLLESVKNQK